MRPVSRESTLLFLPLLLNFLVSCHCFFSTPSSLVFLGVYKMTCGMKWVNAVRITTATILSRNVHIEQDYVPYIKCEGNKK